MQIPQEEILEMFEQLVAQTGWEEIEGEKRALVRDY